ncbi:MAG TPA: Rieske 2Fe-2S domain-containing protein [Telmatospirillum sp.]|nr:Rieske 2Fe-2S domain-containing protein [Telmatospirillum sp.]
MDDDCLLPIEHLEEHDVYGERRWTGRVVMPGGFPINVLILRLRTGLLAVRNRCPHRDIALLRGRLDEAAGILECPSHGWELSLSGSELHARPVIEREGTFFMAR